MGLGPHWLNMTQFLLYLKAFLLLLFLVLPWYIEDQRWIKVRFCLSHLQHIKKNIFPINHVLAGVYNTQEQAPCSCLSPACEYLVRMVQRESQMVRSCGSVRLECIAELLEMEVHTSNFQKMDESCHCINWLSETLCQEKLQLPVS